MFRNRMVYKIYIESEREGGRGVMVDGCVATTNTTSHTHTFYCCQESVLI